MEEAPKLRPRDKLLRDNFTPAEAMLFWVLLIVSFAVFWIGDPRSFWLLGGLLIVGGLTPFILKTHEHTHPFFVDSLWPRFWLYTAPAWLLLLQFLIGLTQNPLGTLSIDQLTFHTPEPINSWRPTATAEGGILITLLGFCATYILTTSLYIVPKSRSFFERLLPLLCIGAVLVCVFGYVQKGLGLTAPIFTTGTGATDFFAFFPYDGHWAAFATLWCSTCTAMALLSMRYDDSPEFIQSKGPWYLTGATLLAATGFLIVARLPAAILLLTFSMMLLIVTVEFLARSKDKHRSSIAISSGLAAALFFASGIYRIFQEDAFSADASHLQSAAFEMFKANPVFGWGFDSYEKLLPFYSSDLLLGQRAERASSDLLQFMAEFGLFGLMILGGFLIAYIGRYIKARTNIRLSNHMLLGCGATLLIAVIDTPFMSPAVFFSFLAIFFGALRWAEISRNNIDEVDAARPQLVTPESERRVPFYNKEYKEKQK